MASVNYSALVEGMHGKLNGSTLQKGNFVNIIRNKAMPFQPRVLAQQTTRSIFSYVTSSWRTLTSAEKATWFISPAPTINGYYLFVQTNFGIIKNGDPLQKTYTPPTPPFVLQLTNVQYSNSTQGLVFTINRSSLDTGEVLKVYFTTPSFKNDAIIEAVEASEDCTSLFSGGNVSDASFTLLASQACVLPDVHFKVWVTTQKTGEGEVISNVVEFTSLYSLIPSSYYYDLAAGAPSYYININANVCLHIYLAIQYSAQYTGAPVDQTTPTEVEIEETLDNFNPCKMTSSVIGSSDLELPFYYYEWCRLRTSNSYVHYDHVYDKLLFQNIP